MMKFIAGFHEQMKGWEERQRETDEGEVNSRIIGRWRNMREHKHKNKRIKVYSDQMTS